MAWTIHRLPHGKSQSPASQAELQNPETNFKTHQKHPTSVKIPLLVSPWTKLHHTLHEQHS